MDIDVREVQSEKHISPKLVTEDGMFIDFREEHLKKQSFPILVTEDGIVIDSREEHSLYLQVSLYQRHTS